MKAGHLLLSVICTDPLTSNVVTETSQLRLQHLDGRRHDDNRRQVIPYLNDRKEAVSEGINRPNWNAESAPMSSCALHVWTEVD